jgi:hypothetical protein
MAEPATSAKGGWWIGAAIVLVLVLAAAVIFRQDILESFLDPKLPFQTYQPPPAPDYGRRASWALLPAAPTRWSPADPPADVFFIHPTTFDGGSHWNGAIDDIQANRILVRTMLPNYAGPFVRVGRLFAPRYRQASLFSQLTLRDDARDARQFAYGDVRRAFDYFLDHFSGRRPVVVVGVEQGGTVVQRLVREELAARPDLLMRLAAVYLIDATALQSDYAPPASLTACVRRGQPRCVVGWNQSYAFDEADIRRTLQLSVVWGAHDQLEELKGREILCVNPLLGGVSAEKAPARLNLGAANASDVDWSTRPAFLTRQVSAQCVGGILRVSQPRSPSLKDTGGWADRLREPGYNLFYADIEADAEARVTGLLSQPEFNRASPATPAPAN